MVLAIDVGYDLVTAKAVGVLFDWKDNIPKKVITEYIDNVEEYIPGKFYLRELPCILRVIEQLDLSKIEAIIVDGYVYIDNNKAPGLGAKLWETLDQMVPIIGVAKRSYYNTEKVSSPIYRGNSLSPLYISSSGIENSTAMHLIKSMHGSHRIPTILKLLDSITKKS